MKKYIHLRNKTLIHSTIFKKFLDFKRHLIVFRRLFKVSCLVIVRFLNLHFIIEVEKNNTPTWLKYPVNSLGPKKYKYFFMEGLTSEGAYNRTKKSVSKRQCSYKKLKPFFKDFSSITFDFQGPPRNIFSQIVQKCTFPVYSYKALRLELFASPTSLHFSGHLLKLTVNYCIKHWALWVNNL